MADQGGTIGARLRAARERAALTQRAAARLAQVTAQAISDYERDLYPPKEEVLGRLAAAYGVAAGALRYGDVTGERLSPERGTEPRAPAKRRLPPRAYERVFGYLERLRTAGADDEQLDVAERIMREERFARLNKATHREPSEDEMLIDIDAGWAAVWEIFTAGGMKIPGPRPRFRKAEDGA